MVKVRLTKCSLKLAAALVRRQRFGGSFNRGVGRRGSVHTARIARTVLLMGRVRRPGLAPDALSAPGKGRSDDERGKPSPPVHRFPPR